MCRARRQLNIDGRHGNDNENVEMNIWASGKMATSGSLGNCTAKDGEGVGKARLLCSYLLSQATGSGTTEFLWHVQGSPNLEKLFVLSFIHLSTAPIWRQPHQHSINLPHVASCLSLALQSILFLSAGAHCPGKFPTRQSPTARPTPGPSASLPTAHSRHISTLGRPRRLLGLWDICPRENTGTPPIPMASGLIIMPIKS